MLSASLNKNISFLPSNYLLQVECLLLLQLSEQLERIAKVNAELRRKNNLHKKQARVLIEERADIEVQLKEKDVQVERVQDMLRQQENYDAEKLAHDVRRKRAQSKGEDDEDEVKIKQIGYKMLLLFVC